MELYLEQMKVVVELFQESKPKGNQVLDKEEALHRQALRSVDFQRLLLLETRLMFKQDFKLVKKIKELNSF
tara:strand:- start:2246 stop:2458 length:213 start_codon:yes stop_codon:yes gene_type:complete